MMCKSFMKKKDYAKALEAYKNALKNNSYDDETRYNYALAKKLLENENKSTKSIVGILDKKIVSYGSIVIENKIRGEVAGHIEDIVVSK